MSAIKLSTPSSGSISLSPANTASDVTITVPAATTTMVGTDTTQTLTNKTLTSPTFTTPNIDSAQFATVSGTAPIYPCRAWVNFNGTGTVAINGSGNVTSITDNGTGDYTVNFTNAMPDSSYCYTASGKYNESGGGNECVNESRTANSRTTTALRIVSFSTSTGSLLDFNTVCVSIFR